MSGVDHFDLATARAHIPEITRGIAEVSLDSLAQRAHLAIVGTMIWPVPENLQHLRPANGFLFRVDQTVLGAISDSIVCVITLMPGDLLQGTALLLLEPRPDGVYEVVSGGAGNFRIRNNEVLRLRTPIEAAIRRVRSASAAAAGRLPR